MGDHPMEHRMEQENVPGVEMNAFIATDLPEIQTLFLYRGTGATLGSLGRHSMNESGKFVARDTVVPYIDLERMYEEEFDFDIMIFNPEDHNDSYYCKLDIKKLD